MAAELIKDQHSFRKCRSPVPFRTRALNYDHHELVWLQISYRSTSNSFFFNRKFIKNVSEYCIYLQSESQQSRSCSKTPTHSLKRLVVQKHVMFWTSQSVDLTHALFLERVETSHAENPPCLKSKIYKWQKVSAASLHKNCQLVPVSSELFTGDMQPFREWVKREKRVIICPNDESLLCNVKP